jgi:MFS family permease
VGRSRTITISMFGSASVMIALSQVNLLPIILVLTALAGLASEAYRPASSALLADLVPAGQRVTAFAALRFVVNAAFALGAATAGLLAQRSFFLLFVADAATSVVFGLLAFLAIHDVHVVPTVSERRGLDGYRSVVADRVFLMFLIAMLLAAFVYLQSYSTFSLQVRALGFSTSVYGGLIALNGLLIVLLELPLTSWTQHRAPPPGGPWLQPAGRGSRPAAAHRGRLYLDGRRNAQLADGRRLRGRPSAGAPSRPVSGCLGSDLGRRPDPRASGWSRTLHLESRRLLADLWSARVGGRRPGTPERPPSRR